MPNRKKKHGKGEIVNWEITVNEKAPMYFTVKISWENQVTRQFHYQFNTEKELLHALDLLEKQNVGKVIMQQTFDEVVHSYAGRNVLQNDKRQRENRSPKHGIQNLETDDFIERWLSM